MMLQILLAAHFILEIEDMVSRKMKEIMEVPLMNFVFQICRVQMLGSKPPTTVISMI